MKSALKDSNYGSSTKSSSGLSVSHLIFGGEEYPINKMLA
jgi:hypothetical protein